MANKYFVTTPGAADPALKAQQEAARAAARLQRTGGVGRITSEAQLRDAQNQWIQAGKPSSGPLYAELMRVSLQRNRAIKEGRPDPITGQRNTKNVFKLPVENTSSSTPAQPPNPFAIQRTNPERTPGVASPQPFASRRVQPQSTIAPSLSQADINAAASSIQNGGVTTAVDRTLTGTQTQAGTNGVMGQATPFADTRQRQQNRNTQFRSQRSGFSGNRRFHPFAGRGA